MSPLEVLALIPARGGSKGIPRKNVLSVAGRPLIAYSIEHALASAKTTRTIVSTDDEEIAEVARQCGAEVPFRRPAEHATDLATDLQVFRHALRYLEEQENYVPDIVMHLRPTDPVRDVLVLDRAIAELAAHPEADSLKSVSLSKFTPYKMWRIDGQKLTPFAELAHLPESHSMPRQLLPPVYQAVGYVDLVRPRTVLEMNSMCGDHVLALVIENHSFDLDYPDQLAEIEQALLAQRKTKAQTTSRRPPAHDSGAEQLFARGAR